MPYPEIVVQVTDDQVMVAVRDGDFVENQAFTYADGISVNDVGWTSGRTRWQLLEPTHELQFGFKVHSCRLVLADVGRRALIENEDDVGYLSPHDVIDLGEALNHFGLLRGYGLWDHKITAQWWLDLAGMGYGS